MIQISIKDGDIFPITKAKDILRSKVASELIKDAAFNIKYFQLDDGQDPQEQVIKEMHTQIDVNLTKE